MLRLASDYQLYLQRDSGHIYLRPFDVDGVGWRQILPVPLNVSGWFPLMCGREAVTMERTV